MSTNGRLDDDIDESREELLTQLELLVEENQQLRESYTRAKQTQYQRTALGLGAVGVLAVVGAILIPNTRDVLLALGAVGLFGSVLTYYITPEQFVSADVGRDVYTALAGNEAALVAELGLTDEQIYVPPGPAHDTVRLFIPHEQRGTLPDRDALDRIVITDESGARGLALDPTGEPLFQSFDAVRSGSLGETPTDLAQQLTDALVEQFELVGAVTTDIDPDGQRLTIGLNDSVYGPVDRFDHPVASLLAVGLATGLDEPISVEVTEGTDARSAYLVTCRWGQQAI
ncbi:hypothetical protein [Haloarcula nitratireducens]|uniref:DUF7982 domain-containing protein n=1 Tax=Haloarcula nitratireducens TaxID=2487749 RepID=A0AAW4PJQ2_9EURY|nr:hypothetical protein [Halomicroarcula nitratireducens]MBX0297798.1 hypothetical protein [Halomicroarcula nitratireducens]